MKITKSGLGGLLPVGISRLKNLRDFLFFSVCFFFFVHDWGSGIGAGRNVVGGLEALLRPWVPFGQDTASWLLVPG